MKIRLIKDWVKPTGKVIKKGAEFHVTMEFGAELIGKRMAKRIKDVEFKKTNIDGNDR